MRSTFYIQRFLAFALLGVAPLSHEPRRRSIDLHTGRSTQNTIVATLSYTLYFHADNERQIVTNESMG